MKKLALIAVAGGMLLTGASAFAAPAKIPEAKDAVPGAVVDVEVPAPGWWWWTDNSDKKP